MPNMSRPEHFARPTSGTRQNRLRTCLKCPKQVLWTCQAISQQPVVQEQSMTYQFISTFNEEFISKVLLCIKAMFNYTGGGQKLRTGSLVLPVADNIFK